MPCFRIWAARRRLTVRLLLARQACSLVSTSRSLAVTSIRSNAAKTESFSQLQCATLALRLRAPDLLTTCNKPTQRLKSSDIPLSYDQALRLVAQGVASPATKLTSRVSPPRAYLSHRSMKCSSRSQWKVGRKLRWRSCAMRLEMAS